MFANNIKTAIRSLLKNKGFTLLNLLGLTLGISTCLLILFYVADELSYDNYNLKLDRIFRINTDLKSDNTFSSRAIAAPVVASKMMKDFPEVERATRILPDIEYVKKAEEIVAEDNVAVCDANIFEVFTLPLLFGNPQTALKDHGNVVISESIARKYFGKVNVLSQTMTCMGDSNSSVQYKISGVMKDMPTNSHFHFDMLLLMPDNDISKNENVAALYSFRTYLLLRPGADYRKLELKFPSFLRANLGFYDAMIKAGDYMRMNLTPLREIHLYSDRTDELGKNSSIQYVKIFSVSAFLILFIASFNFMNLSTARSTNRAREVGIRKVLGSSRSSLVAQFLTESFLLTISGCVIALFLAWILLPWFNQISGKQISMGSQMLPWLLGSSVGFIIVIGILAGSYPAFFLSAFQPIQVLKNKLFAGPGGGRLRNALIVLQFSISVCLIACTLVIYSQLNYIHNKNIGFSRDQILIVKNMNSLLGNDAARMKLEAKQLPGVMNATLSSFLPVGNRRWENFVSGNEKNIQSQFWPVDEDYLPTMGMQIVKGRNFSKQFPTDSNAVLINETAVRMFAFAGNDPLGKEILYGRNKHFHIVGVIRDFNFNSLRNRVTPTLFMMLNGWSTKEEGDGADNLSMKIKPEKIKYVLAWVESFWKSSGVKRPFEYSFMDDDFNELYKSEQQMMKIFVSFTTLAIIISCLGLFGLAAYAAEQRNKEISIRKVLGASISNIVTLLSKSFIRLIVIAIVIAVPVAWLLMQKWLEDFAFRINIPLWAFGVAGLTSIVIAFLTISSQSIKAAIKNPTHSLRSE
jgi:putative ABC transport system permease protein